MSDGFYKYEGGVLLYGKEFVMSAAYTLTRENKDSLTLPIDGWNWFDNEDAARSAYGLPPSALVGTVVDAMSVPVWAMRYVLKQHGLFTTMDAFVEAHKLDMPTLWEVWNYGNYFVRNSPAIMSLGPTFGLSAEQIDALFLEASTVVA